jgi:hypothetical protein
MSEIRLAELLGSLSFAGDLGRGQPMEQTSTFGALLAPPALDRQIEAMGVGARGGEFGLVRLTYMPRRH